MSEGKLLQQVSVSRPGGQTATTLRLLVVEDDPALGSVLEATLNYGGFEIELARDGLAALEMIATTAFRAVILDLGLPDMDGRQLLKALRQRRDLPILVVSGQDTEANRIEALDLGADDFIGKPFLPGELLARLRSTLRRREAGSVPAPRPAEVAGPKAAAQRLEVGVLMLDPEERMVVMGDRQMSLTGSEFAILRQLALKSGTTVARGQLEEALYGQEQQALRTNILDVHISHLRRKLRELTGDTVWLQSRRGLGWALRVPAG